VTSLNPQGRRSYIVRLVWETAVWRVQIERIPGGETTNLADLPAIIAWLTEEIETAVFRPPIQPTPTTLK